MLFIGAAAWAFFEFTSANRDLNSRDDDPVYRGLKRLRGAETQLPVDPSYIRPVVDFPADAISNPNSEPIVDAQELSEKAPVLDSPDAASPTANFVRADTVAHAGDTTVARISASDTLSRKAGFDSAAVKPDSVRSLDSLKLSAWLNGMRHTQPQAAIFARYQYPLFLYAGVVQHITTIDSTGKFVNIREVLLNNDIRIPLQIPIDEYVKLEEEHSVRSTWENLAHQYTLAAQNELGSFMAGVTNIDIPIPPNPVLSIFGPPRINLKISGAVDIHGAWRNQKLNAQTLSQLGNVTNQPDFKQDVQINVGGTVGDKLTIGANWDTQNQFDYENQLQIKYKGYDDEVVKSVEAGNVSMSTPSSFIGSNQALFGIKTEMQMGPVTLTALASQQKAQSKTLTVSNGSSSQTFSLHAYQFATNHYFIDTSYIAGYEPYYQKSGNPYTRNTYVTDYEVYVSQPTTIANPNMRQGYAVIDLPPIPAGQTTMPALYDSLRSGTASGQVSPSWQIEPGRFQKLDPSQFTIDPKTGVLSLNTSIQQNQIVAIAFTTADGTTYGTFSYTDTSAVKKPLVLNMIVPQNLTPSETDAWRLMLRNIYPTGGLNFDKNSLQNVQITYTPPGQAAVNTIGTTNLLQIFGLDKTGPDGSGGPDGQLDWNPYVDINPQTGEIILPFLKPFVEAFNPATNPEAQGITGADSFAYPQIYDTTADIAAQQFGDRDRFLITGTYTSSATSHYNLGFNLVDGSVKVLLNGNPLTAGVDYTVDYVTGEVDIKNPTALTSGANVQIQYETNDIFQIASKTLMGARADVKVNDNTDIGFTLMSYTQQSPNDKVRLGEEPISNLILGADAGTSIDLPFLTKALDALPLIQTAAPSRLTVHGEMAYMLPNPNTRSSVIPDDNGQGVAYIDDFEGSKKTIPLPITFSNWTLASPPAVSVLDSLHPGIVDSVKNNYRAWTYWYNRIPSVTSVKDIWPNKNVPADQSTQTVLSIGMLDTVRGQYNRAKDLTSTLKADPTQAWGGMMTLLSSNASDLVSQNINYIEIWMKVDEAPGNGTMHIDLGQVSEDIIGDRFLHTEDTTGLGTLLPGLDLGLDLMNDTQERKAFPWIVANSDRPWDPNGNDPEGDDYYYANSSTPADSSYFQVNGTEGNSVTESGRLPDTEDLNHNGTLDLLNSYFEYAVKLDTTKNPFIAGGGSNKWYQYIIPLQDFERAVGNPSLSNVQYVRVWFNGMTGPMQVRIAEMNLVGNYWRTPNQNDSTMQVSVVNIEDNPGYSAPVPGLQPTDYSNPNGPIKLNEQSLALILNGLPDDSSRYVYKTFPQPQNFFNYHTMKMFVHGDPSFNYVDSTNYDAEIYMRFGSDANNYYEYRQPIKYGWQDMTVDFASLTSIKQKRDSINQAISRSPANNGIPGATYWLQGNPSLQNVTYFQIGVVNPEHCGTTLPLFGEVWVDELRLTNVDNTPGLAYQLSSNVQLADFGSISFNFTHVDPYFHTLTTQFGSRNTQRNWGISGSFSLERLLPREWLGTTIPFSYSHTESFANPLYLPNSDILVTEAVQRRTKYLIEYDHMAPDSAAMIADSLLTSSQSMTVSDQWGISSMRIKFPSDKWYIRDIVDNISMGFNWNGSKFRNPQTKTGSQWAWQYNAGYSVQFDPMAYFTPFPSKTNGPVGGQQGQGDFQIRYLPNTLTLSMSASRSLTLNKLWSQPLPIVTPNFTAQRSGGINWKLTNNGFLNPTIDYRFNVGSSMLYLETDTTSTGALRLLPGSYVFRQIFLHGGLINFGNDYTFSEQFALTTQPKLPFGTQKYMDLQASYNSGYQWTNNIQQGAIGKGAGFSSSLQLGTNLRLKSLADSWFSVSTAPQQAQAPERGGRGQGRGRGREEFEAPAQDTTSSSGGGNPLGNLFNVLVKVPFLDYENVSINFSTTNTSSNGGLPSLRPGMGNFFRLPFIQESNPELGPSQLYQLGLVSDPYSTLMLSPKKSFPFFGFTLGPTRRIALNGVNITDNFSNSNTLDIRTSRNLWAGARIDLSWHVGWSYNRNVQFQTDSLGFIIPSSVTTQVSGQVSRSFFTVPPVLIFSVFKSSINQVASIYQNLTAADPNNLQSSSDQKASQAFLQGFETLPILDKIFGQYMPRMNYSFTWSGLENLPLFKSFASQVSLNNAYQSTYTQNWHNSLTGTQINDAQTISYGFQPLIGLNIAFKSFGDANISGSILYNTSTQYALTPSSGNIAESYTGQLSITADYAKRGFSLPLFGLNLKNDIDISASYSVSQTSRSSYAFSSISAGPTPLDGTSQIAIQLTFKYALSQRVTASIYYKNTRVVPTVPGSPIPGTTTNEAGIDVHVSIAG